MIAGIIVIGALILTVRARGPAQSPIAPLATLQALLACSVDELSKLDIARMNLLCTEGLPGHEPLAIDRALSQLDAWAARVRSETDRHRYRFARNPGEFDHSRGFFHMMFLAVVLAEDYGVHYKLELRTDPAAATMYDGFFADPHPVFLSGLLGERREGTCSSLPVLYVAVGRRLGYPLKLVTTKGHLFLRWEDASERFNLEVTGRGLNRYADEEYRTWPYPVSEAEVQSQRYLVSLSPAEELAVFLSTRGMCLRDARRMRDAAEAFGAAARLAPGVASYGMMAARCRIEAGRVVNLARKSGGM